MKLEKQKQIQERFEVMYRLGIKPWVWHGLGPAWNDFLRYLSKKHPRAKVLDIGCGNGWISIELAKRGYEVWGIDSSKSAIYEANKLAKKAGVEKITHFQVGDALDLPYDNNSFDALLDRGLFHHILPENRSLYFQDILRVLKPESLIYLAVFSTENPNFIGQLFSPKMVKKLFEPHFTILYFSQDPDFTLNLVHLFHFILESKP